MSDACNIYRSLLSAGADAGRAHLTDEALAAHLDACAGCRRAFEQWIGDDTDLDELVAADAAALERIARGVRDGLRAAPESARPRFRSTPRARLAAAAVVLLCVLLGANLLNRDGGPGVVWADVLAQVEQADSYICRRTEKRTGEPQRDIIEYRAAAHGLRQDIYRGDRLEATQYILPRQKLMLALIHRDRTYMQQHLTDEQVAELRRQSDAAEIVRSFRDREHRVLDGRRIDGARAEGIEIVDPPEWREMFDSARWRLWVDKETGWPVRIELEGTAAGGDVRKTFILHDFQWNAALSPAEFKVDVPADYRLIADLGEVVADEETALASLRAYAKLLDGRYPSRLNFATAIAEAEAELDARHDRYDEAAGRDLGALFAVRSACRFFNDLAAAGREATWHGDSVTARDFDRVLMRWRLDDGSWRVVYGDLRTATVAGE